MKKTKSVFDIKALNNQLAQLAFNDLNMDGEFINEDELKSFSDYMYEDDKAKVLDLIVERRRIEENIKDGIK
ncbi:MAG: hypothetical protein JWQ09_5877 [Segetibacter sp.]|nr:hypothetical protein [Segetibacter sp.]